MVHKSQQRTDPVMEPGQDPVMEITPAHNFDVIDHTSKWVSGAYIIEGEPRQLSLDRYARGCGWPSAKAMAEYYPINEFTFVKKVQLKERHYD